MEGWVGAVRPRLDPALPYRLLGWNGPTGHLPQVVQAEVVPLRARAAAAVQAGMAHAEVEAGHAEPNTELLATHTLLNTFQDSLGLHRPADAGRALAMVIARRAVALSEAESLKATVVADTIARLGLVPSAHVPLVSASTRT